jgi:hypothetical protein
MQSQATDDWLSKDVHDLSQHLRTLIHEWHGTTPHFIDEEKALRGESNNLEWKVNEEGAAGLPAIALAAAALWMKHCAANEPTVYAVCMDMKGQQGVYGPVDNLSYCLNWHPPIGWKDQCYIIRYENGGEKRTPIYQYNNKNQWTQMWARRREKVKKECSRCAQQFDVPEGATFHSDLPSYCNQEGCMDCPHYSTCLGTLQKVEA